MPNADHLIWVDLEMTGLEPDYDTIIEIATIVTDSNLKIISEGPVFAIHQSEATMNAMDEWNTRQHGESGLTQRVLTSQTTMTQAETATIDWLTQYVPAGVSPMCGNSIGQDRRFMVKFMPQLESFFHYRNMDVSSIKELARRWRPDVLNGVKKNNCHLALDDIRDSIAELQHYREHFFNLHIN